MLERDLNTPSILLLLSALTFSISGIRLPKQTRRHFNVYKISIRRHEVPWKSCRRSNDVLRLLGPLVKSIGASLHIQILLVSK